MLRCFYPALEFSRRLSCKSYAPWLSAARTLSTGLCLYLSSTTNRYTGKNQYKVIWHKARDNADHCEAATKSSACRIHTDVAQEVARSGKQPVYHGRSPLFSSPEKLGRKSRKLARSSPSNTVNLQNDVISTSDPGLSSKGSAMLSPSVGSHHSEDCYSSWLDSTDELSHAISGVKASALGDNGFQSSVTRSTMQADTTAEVRETVASKSTDSRESRLTRARRFKIQSAELERSSNKIGRLSRTNKTSPMRSMATSDCVMKKRDGGPQNTGINNLLRRLATSSLPTHNPLTGEALPGGDYRMKGILRGMYNKARRPHLPADPELIQNEVARRLTSLYPYTYSHFTWVEWYRLLVVPSSHRDRSWYLRKLHIMGKEGARWAASHIEYEDFPTRIIGDWRVFPEKQRAQMWPTAMLQCLMSSAHVSVSFLEATLPISYPSFEMLADSLWAIRVLYAEDLASNKTLQATFKSLIQYLFDFKSWPWEGLPERHLGLILEYASAQQTFAIFSRIVNKKLKHLPSDMLRFMDKFTQDGDVENSLEALYFYSKRRTYYTIREKHMSTPHVLKRCANLLKLDFVTKQRSSQNFMILPAMLKMGINPDQILYNIVIDNAFKNDVSEVGWDVFRFLKANNLPCDSYTYVALLKDGLRHWDSSKIIEILTEVLSNNDIQPSDPLLSYVLHVIRKLYWLRDRCTTSACYHALFSVYRKHRSLLPLLKLGMHSHLEPEIDSPNHPLPSRETLGVILNAYIFSRHDSAVVFDTYQRFRHLLHANDPQTSILAETDHVYNAFISRLGHNNHYLPECLGIAQDMLHHPRPGLVKPTQKTFGLLIAACIKHGEVEAAEQVRRVMRKQGLEETDFIRGKVADGHELSAENMWTMMAHVQGSSATASESAFWDWEEEESLNDANGMEFSRLIEKLREMRGGGDV